MRATRPHRRPKQGLGGRLGLIGSALDPRALSYLILYPTARCNARCRTCFYSAQLNRSDRELTLDEYGLITEKLGFVPYVLLGGGEPLLREDLVEIIGLFRERCGLRYLSIPTNALLPERTEYLAREVLSRVAPPEVHPPFSLRLALSVDGVGEQHDRIRGVPGNFVKLRETHDRLAAVRAADPRLHLHVSTCYCRSNAENIREIIDEVKERFAFDSHSLGLIRPGGPAAGETEVDPASYRAVLEYLRQQSGVGERRPLGRVLRAADRVRADLQYSTLAEDRAVLPCVAGRKLAVLFEEGDLWACEPKPEYALGNVREAAYDLPAMLASERARAVRRDIRATSCHCGWECALAASLLLSRAGNFYLFRSLLRRVTGTSSSRP
jgi:MoaA/NifB/PqqE/SkfB family radical SAM enzyme